MRLFKLLIIGMIVGSTYFYAKQHTDNASDDRSSGWETVTTASGVSIKFPKHPVSKSFQKNIEKIGKTKLTTYQSNQDNHVFIMLWATPLKKSNQQKEIQHKELPTLEAVIHAINDTRQLNITHKQTFVLQSHYGVEYKATHSNGTVLWCRTVKKGNQLYSAIYASHSQDSDKQLRDRFFQSFHM